LHGTRSSCRDPPMHRTPCSSPDRLRKDRAQLLAGRFSRQNGGLDLVPHDTSRRGSAGARKLDATAPRTAFFQPKIMLECAP
jgi:hypothetical protein